MALNALYAVAYFQYDESLHFSSSSGVLSWWPLLGILAYSFYLRMHNYYSISPFNNSLIGVNRISS